ncbi:MAG: hypothetical protein H6835_09545 [Planctomycetes bacterium]|nr:hypothetical protein [Planctomycetota bacterium]
MLKTFGFVSLGLAASLAAQDCSDLGTNYGVGDDVVVNSGNAIPIGFAFPLGGSTFTDLHPSTNGFVYLSNAGAAITNGDATATSAELASGPPRICPLWTDLNMLAANNGAVWVNSSATECTVTWRNAVCWNQTVVFTVQMKLFPSGDVQFLYGPGATNTSTFGPAALVGASLGGGVTLPAASDFLVAGATTDDTVFEEFLAAGSFDLPNDSLFLFPTAPGWTWAAAGPMNNCVSKARSYGTGCGFTNTVGEAKYELFTAFDLSNTGQTYAWTGTGYVLADGAGAIVPAVNTPTTFGDDNTQQIPLGFTMPSPAGGTSNIWLCSNGWLSFQATTSTDLSESIADHLAGVAKLAFLWDDLAPNQAGTVTIDYPSATQCIVTFDGVTQWNAADSNTVQVVLNSNGDIEVRYGACALLDCLVGVSPGNAAIDGGSVNYSDLATTGPVIIDTHVGPFGFSGLALFSNVPVLGTNWDLTTSNIDPISPISVTFFGALPVDPGFDLTTLGAPGCNLHITLPPIAQLTGISVGGSSTVTLAIPVNPALVGASAAAQSVCLTLGNTLALYSSNGVEGTFGY